MFCYGVKCPSSAALCGTLQLASRPPNTWAPQGTTLRRDTFTPQDLLLHHRLDAMNHRHYATSQTCSDIRDWTLGITDLLEITDAL
ncbi:unnamed protein product [Arctogadus glacialis]